MRTFDAPEALDVRFHEVHARSAINAVPERSRMPFRFTINPYRGCTHGCTYCLDPATPVLLANGRTRPIDDLAAGDEIVGTERAGAYRRFVTTTVRDKWDTWKAAYRVLLADGTELIASGDHRFLSNRGWKHVIGAEQGPLTRPHLTLKNRLIGTGSFAPTPEHCGDYRRGYLCGMVRGDGSLGSYSYPRRRGGGSDVHRFRLALIDGEALGRTRGFLSGFGVPTDEFLFQPAGAVGNSKAVHAIRTSRKQAVQAVRDLIEWPLRPSKGWTTGYLAGIFDAEGGCSRGVLRIANMDQAIIDHTAGGLRGFGFDAVLEKPRPGMQVLRLRGGLSERLRFFHSMDPVITRKRVVEGAAVKIATDLRVLSIEPAGDRRLCDITTGTGDFVADGVISHNCFARPTHTYLGFNSGRDFDREIVVKVNAPELVRAELGRKGWEGGHVALGTNTDPYQWVESKYRLMPGIWEAMRDFSNPCSVLTKSPLLLRDTKLFQEISKRTEFVANLSIPTLDEKAWRASEPHTPHPRTRIAALAELTRAGISTGVLIAPLMPGINDDPAQVERILELVGEAGVSSVGGIGLASARRDQGRVHGLAAPIPARSRPAIRAALLQGRLPAKGRAGAAGEARRRRPQAAALRVRAEGRVQAGTQCRRQRRRRGVAQGRRERRFRESASVAARSRAQGTGAFVLSRPRG